MSEWKEYKLKEIATVVDCEHKTAPVVDVSDYYSVRTANISGGKIDINNCNRISFETYEIWTKRLRPQEGDIILAREAPVGEVGWVPGNKNVCLGQRTVLIRVNNGNVLPKYLLYYLTNNETKCDLISRSTGSVVEHLNVKDIKEFDIRVHPSKKSQIVIAAVLSSLDDKIDLLHRQNKTLEALAETIFRQWFVEEAEDSSIGKLGDILELTYGKALKEEIRTGTGFPVIGSSGVVGYHSEYLVEGPGIVIGRKGTLGRVTYLFENFFPIDTTYFIKPRVNSEGMFYEYFLLKTLDFEGMNSDSAVPGLNRDIAHSTEIKITSVKKIREFNSCCSVYFQKIKSNTDQINTLTQLRNSLLPKLMSGEVRVKM